MAEDKSARKSAINNIESPGTSGHQQLAQTCSWTCSRHSCSCNASIWSARAMGCELPGWILDLCLGAPQLSHRDRLHLLRAVDDLCLNWQVDLELRHELPAELEAHVQSTASGADALLMLTERQLFKTIDWQVMAVVMRQPACLFDSRAKADASSARAVELNVWKDGEKLIFLRL